MNKLRVEQTPFTIYDVMGYLGPGAFAMWLFLMLTGHPYRLLDSEFYDVFFVIGESVLGQAFSAVIGVVTAYIVGLLLSFGSKETVEKLNNYFFGYPSSYLLESPDGQVATRKFIDANLDSHRILKSKDPKVQTRERLSYRAIVLFLGPIAFPLFLISRYGSFRVFLKEIPQEAKAKLAHELSNGASTSVAELVDDGAFWFRKIIYFLEVNEPFVFIRAYNHVIIYGFIRSVVFIFILIFWHLLLNQIFQYHSAGQYGGWGWILGSAIASFVLFLAFLRIYRRYCEYSIWAYLLARESAREAGLQKMPDKRAL